MSHRLTVLVLAPVSLIRIVWTLIWLIRAWAHQVYFLMCQQLPIRLWWRHHKLHYPTIICHRALTQSQVITTWTLLCQVSINSIWIKATAHWTFNNNQKTIRFNWTMNSQRMSTILDHMPFKIHKLIIAILNRFISDWSARLLWVRLMALIRLQQRATII